MKKAIFLILLWLILSLAIVTFFILVVLPEFNRDWATLYYKELQDCEQKLEVVTNDLNQALVYDDVELNIDDEYVNITITGDVCTLNVTLGRDLKVVSYGTVDKSDDKMLGPIFGSIALGVTLILAILAMIFKILDIRNIIRENRARKLDNKINVIV